MIDVMLDVEDADADPMAVVKLQAQTWELNIRAPLSDLVRLGEVRDANWETRRSLAIGTCAGAGVYWACSDGQVTVLVGHDDETWDIAMMVPLASVEEIVSLAEQQL